MPKYTDESDALLANPPIRAIVHTAPPVASYTEKLPTQKSAESIDVKLADYVIASTAKQFLDVRDADQACRLALTMMKLIKERRDIAGLNCGKKGSNHSSNFADPLD